MIDNTDHHHIDVPANLKTTDEVYQYFLNYYGKLDKAEILALMQDSVSDEQFAALAKRDALQLAEIYCHGMVAGYFVCGTCHSHVGHDVH